MPISYVPTPTDRVRDVLFRDTPAEYVRVYDDRIFYSATTGIPKSEGRTLDAEKKQALVNKHLLEISARLNAGSVPTPPEPDPEMYLLTPAEYRNDLYAFYHWTCKSKDLKGIKKAFSISNTPCLLTEHECECCARTFFLQFGKLGYSCNTPCPDCRHDGTDGCLCAICVQHTATLKQNIHDLLASVAPVIQNSWEQLIGKASEAPDAPSKEASDTDLYLLSAKYRTSSLTSDERCFLHHYIDMRNRGLEPNALDVLNNAPIKNLKKAYQDLMQHGVIISKRLELKQDIVSVISHVQSDIFSDVQVDCDFKSGRGCFRISSFVNESDWGWSLEDVMKVRGIQVYSDEQTVYERIETRALDALRRSGPIEYRVNPFYLEPLSSLPPKLQSTVDRSVGNPCALSPVFKSPQEAAIFASLQREHPGKIVLPNYPFANIVDCKKLLSIFSREEVSQLRRMIFDFVICDSAGNPFIAVECQHGKHHNEPEYMEIDYLKMRLCAAVGLEHREIHGRFDKQVLA